MTLRNIRLGTKCTKNTDIIKGVNDEQKQVGTSKRRKCAIAY